MATAIAPIYRKAAEIQVRHCCLTAYLLKTPGVNPSLKTRCRRLLIEASQGIIRDNLKLDIPTGFYLDQVGHYDKQPASTLQEKLTQVHTQVDAFMQVVRGQVQVLTDAKLQDAMTHILEGYANTHAG